MAPLRKALILAALAVIWELAARYQGNPLMLPTFGAAASALVDSIQRDGLLWRAWAFAWRTLIAAELVFGVSSGAGGLGWYIFQARNELYTDRVFAGLAAVIIIGFVVENTVFRTAENATVNRWGMLR